MSIEDAPWIREAETDGMPEEDEPICPVCGEECEELYIVDGDVIGCDCCVNRVDASDWLYSHRS